MGVSLQDAGGGVHPPCLKDNGAGAARDLDERRRTLLLVEDDEDTADVLRMWLEADGYEVATAASGWEAVGSALRGRFDAILMDMSLPMLDGMSALRLMRAHEALRAVPVVALTAYDAAYPRAEAMAAQCDEYMVKPLDFGRLGAVLRRLLR